MSRLEWIAKVGMGVVAVVFVTFILVNILIDLYGAWRDLIRPARASFRRWFAKRFHVCCFCNRCLEAHSHHG